MPDRETLTLLRQLSKRASQSRETLQPLIDDHFAHRMLYAKPEQRDRIEIEWKAVSQFPALVERIVGADVDEAEL